MKSSTQAWREIGGREIYLRSRWEANYCRYLEFLKTHHIIKEWEHEPKTFWFPGIKRGVVTYLPDFKVTELDDSHHWVEVKGYYDSKSLTKIKRFRKYFPEEKLKLIDGKWFSLNNPKLKGLVKGWEYAT